MARKNAVRTEQHDAIELLKADHREVEQLFERFEKAKKTAEKDKLAQKICLELSVHTAIEEELLYPLCRGEVEEDLIDEAYVEHDGAKNLIAELLSAKKGEPFRDAKVMVLSEMIKHHVKEEEQRDGLFAQAKRSGLDMFAVGQRLLVRKTELKEKFEAAGVPKPVTRSMSGEPPNRGAPVE